MGKSLSDYQAGDLVANNPYFHQMSMSVLVAAMVDFVSPLPIEEALQRLLVMKRTS